MKTRAQYSLPTTLVVTDSDGEGHDVEVVIHFNASHTPARLYGEPENCYPEEGELEIVWLDILSDLPSNITEADVRAEAETNEDSLWEVYHEAKYERYEE